MRLTAHEANLVSIYHSGSRPSTVEQIREALPYMDNMDVCVAQGLLVKLEAMSDSTFAVLNLDPEEVAV